MRIVDPIAVLLGTGFVLTAQIAPPMGIPNYAQGARDQVPAAFRWRTEDIYRDAEAWKPDLVQARGELERLSTQFPGWTTSPSRMADFLDLEARLRLRAEKLEGYATLGTQVQRSTPLWAELLNQVRPLLQELDTRFSTRDGQLLGVGSATLEAYRAAEPRLRAHEALFRKILRGKDHLRAEDTEKVLAEMATFTEGAKEAARHLLGREFRFEDALLPSGARVPGGTSAWFDLQSSADPGARRAGAEAQARSYQRLEHTFAALLDASVKRDVFEAKVRNFPDTVSFLLFRHEIEPIVYPNLIHTVKRNLGTLHRYLQVRRRLLALPEYRAWDRFLKPLPEVPLHFTFEATRTLTQEAGARLGPEYGALVRRAFEDGWMDVYAHKDKDPWWGMSSSNIGPHPYIHLNFDGSFFMCETVAHELGHATQHFLAHWSQPFAAATPSWFTTEIPSQVLEFLLMRRLVDTAPDDRARLARLCAFVDRLELVLFDSTRHAEFQRAIYHRVEQGAALNPAWLDAQNLVLRRAYGGHDRGAMAVDDFLRSDWEHRELFVSDLRSFSLAFNAAAALGICQRVLEGDTLQTQRYLAFLKAGSSEPPLDLLRKAGMDFSTSQPFEAAMRSFERLVDRWKPPMGA